MHASLFLFKMVKLDNQQNILKEKTNELYFYIIKLSKGFHDLYKLFFIYFSFYLKSTKWTKIPQNQ